MKTKTYQHLKLKFHPHPKHNYYLKSKTLKNALQISKPYFEKLLDKKEGLFQEDKDYFYKGGKRYFSLQGCTKLAHYMEDLNFLLFLQKLCSFKKVQKQSKEHLRRVMLFLEQQAYFYKEQEKDIYEYIEEHYLETKKAFECL